MPCIFLSVRHGEVTNMIAAHPMLGMRPEEDDGLVVWRQLSGSLQTSLLRLYYYIAE